MIKPEDIGAANYLGTKETGVTSCRKRKTNLQEVLVGSIVNISYIVKKGYGILYSRDGRANTIAKEFR